jgi:hypothetical protein
MGAIMAQGILDAGGRNACVALRSRAGFFRRTTVIGLAMFTQYWYWHPLSYCLGLAFQPSGMVGVAGDMRVPKFDVECGCKPSIFAYPEPLTQHADKQVGAWGGWPGGGRPVQAECGCCVAGGRHVLRAACLQCGGVRSLLWW